MIYIHQSRCISPQQTFIDVDLSVLHPQKNRQLLVMEPPYPGVSPGTLRRMGKAGRIGTGAAMSMMQNDRKIDGIIIGTANGGMEESIRFIKQIVEYKEDMLAPGSFVQSTANATTAQLAIVKKNHGYNITHVHRALAFENALIDTMMLLQENPGGQYLTGGVDEIASYNYRIEYQAGWYKHEDISNSELYQTGTPGSIAGEGAAMFIVSNEEEHAIAQLRAIKTIHSSDVNYVADQWKIFIDQHIQQDGPIDLFLSGENGDVRYDELFQSCEKVLPEDITIARFKHLCGEYPTASAFALWLACEMKSLDRLPDHLIKRRGKKETLRNIVVMNSHHGDQHSFMLVRTGA